MAVYSVQKNGKAQSGLKKGDQVVTGGGTYEITGVNSDGSYTSKKINNTTTSTYKGTYANSSSGTTSSGSSGGSSSSGSSGNSWSSNRYSSTGGDLSKYGTNQMASGASWQDVAQTYYDRMSKIMNTPGLEQYKDDDIQKQMWDYITNAQKAESKQAREEYIEDFEYDEEKPTYDSSWTPAMQEMLNKILNREDFSYDALSDPLYQQYSAQYQREGNRAMRNTLAEAAASAGGMNSYAITAAQQANDYYNSQLSDKIPELYQLAYQMYLQDKESMVEDFGLLQSMDNTQYNRYRDTMQDYYNDKNFAYGLYADAVQQGNWQQNFDYNTAVTDRNYYYNSAQDAINNDWKNKEWDNKLSQQELENSRYNDTLAREDEKEAREKAEAQVYALLDLGKMPDDSLIEASGLDKAFVSAYYTALKEQPSNQTNKQKIVYKYKDDEEYDEKDGDDEDNIISTEMSEEELVKKAATDVASPNLTANALSNMLSWGWIEYDQNEDKFKRTFDFGGVGKTVTKK